MPGVRLRNDQVLGSRHRAGGGVCKERLPRRESRQTRLRHCPEGKRVGEDPEIVLQRRDGHTSWHPARRQRPGLQERQPGRGRFGGQRFERARLQIVGTRFPAHNSGRGAVRQRRLARQGHSSDV